MSDDSTEIEWPFTVKQSFLLAVILGSVTYIPTQSLPLTIFATSMYLLILPPITYFFKQYERLQKNKQFKPIEDPHQD